MIEIDENQITFIKEKNASYAANIDEFNIGQILSNKLNGKDKRQYIITDKTVNTIEVLIPKDPNSLDHEGNIKGVDSKQWFLMGDFVKKFK